MTVQPISTDWIDQAVVDGGGVLVEPADADAVVWTHKSAPEDLSTLLAANPGLRWVQLPWAGVDPYRPLFDRERAWTCAKGVYADPVAEHALALLLAGYRNLGAYARATSWGWGEGRNLYGAKVTIVGGGGIGQVLIRLLSPFGCEVTVVRRRVQAMDGVARVLPATQLAVALRGADALVLALPLVDDTDGLIGAEELALLAPGAWVINVARGEHLDTEALLAVLESGHLGGAGLDVTDPEPLPEGHPLWLHPNVIITPHTANTPEMAKPLLGRRIRENVAHWAAGEPLDGVVDPELGY